MLRLGEISHGMGAAGRHSTTNPGVVASQRLVNSKRRTSSTMADTAFTTDFMGVRMRVGAFERPAVRTLSMADRNTVMWMSSKPPSAATGS